MQRQATWRALAVAYGVVAGIQLYLAITMNAPWAWVLAAICATAAVGFGAAAGRRDRSAVGDDAAIASGDRRANTVVTTSTTAATSSHDHLW